LANFFKQPKSQEIKLTPANTISSLFKKALTYGALLVLGVTLLGSILGFVLAGANGIASALIGGALTLVFASTTAVSIWFGGRLNLGAFFAIVMGAWLLKIVIFMVLVATLKGASFVHGPTLFFTLVGSIIGSLALDSVLVLKARIPVVQDH
jgi:hypothetical protein